MIKRFQSKGVEVRQAWGMTETSPLGLSAALKPHQLALPEADRLALQCKQGRPQFGMEFRVADKDGPEVTHDGKSIGSLLVRGPWVAAQYFNAEDADTHEQHPGWFDTGDVVTIDKDSFIQIVDRNKDLIKSGGEWISSIELENIAQDHPAIKEAAIVAVPDSRWDERPALVVVLKPGATFSYDDMRAQYEGKTSKWHVPDHLVVVDKLPHTATGKISKKDIRHTLITSLGKVKNDVGS